MNAKVRMMADARSLFWPWCIVAAAGILPLLSLRPLLGALELEPEVVAGIGFCIGMPVLATLIFGNEFQFGTLSSLLSQPIERSTVWREKSVMIVAAVLSSGVAYGFAADRMGWEIRAIGIAALWLMVTICSAAYWTLVARSTIGGLALNGLQSMALVLVSVPLLNKRPQPLMAITGFAVVYTAVLIYLGRRKLLRYQVTGAGSGANLLATEWKWAPNPVRRLLRCTANGGTLNLVRKEIRLLWPMLPLLFIAVGILMAVVTLRFVPGYERWAATLGISIILTHGFLATMLAGALSLGEERSQGLHTGNMTLPVSFLRQWAIKLVTAILASAACSGAVVLMARLLFGRAFLQEFAGPYLALFPLLTFIPFWCATGVNGTVRATFWCVPAAGAVLIAYSLGIAACQRAAVEIIRTLTAAVHPFPFSSESGDMAWKLTWSQWNVLAPALWLNVWLVPPAAIQSYRLFRSEIQGGIPLIRQTLLLAAIGFISGFLQYVPAAATGTMHQNTGRALREIARGVNAMKIDPAKVSDAGYTVSLDTIANSVALSDRTRRSLATDTVLIRPKTVSSFAFRNNLLEETQYFIIAELHGGWKCAFADNIEEHGPSLFYCKSNKGTLGWLSVDF